MNPSVQKTSMGVLNFKGGNRRFQLFRYLPSEKLGYFIKHFWVVHWDFTGLSPYSQDVIPNPCVNMVIEENNSRIYGVSKQKFSKLLKGKGTVLGVKFKPGAFYPFIQTPVSRITNHSIDIQDVFGIKATTIENLIFSQEETGMVQRIEDFMQKRLSKKDPNIIIINQIIDRIIEDRAITKVDQICKYFHINKRRLQRIFNQYVGVNPKWVIKLYRLQNAAETIDNEQSDDMLQLAIDLGYFDQAHFIRDFKLFVGKTPAEYARQKHTTPH